MSKLLGNQALDQMRADHAWIKQQRRAPRRGRGRYGDDRQPLIEVCLTEDLDGTSGHPADGLVVRRDGANKYQTADPVNVWGDEDFSATVGHRVIAGWLHGEWRAIRRSGRCSSSSSSSVPSSSPSSPSSPPSSSSSSPSSPSSSPSSSLSSSSSVPSSSLSSSLSSSVPSSSSSLPSSSSPSSSLSSFSSSPSSSISSSLPSSSPSSSPSSFSSSPPSSSPSSFSPSSSSSCGCGQILWQWVGAGFGTYGSGWNALGSCPAGNGPNTPAREGNPGDFEEVCCTCCTCGYAVYQWDSLEADWTLVENSCDPGILTPGPPGFSGLAHGQLASVCCNCSSSSVSSSVPSSSPSSVPSSPSSSPSSPSSLSSSSVPSSVPSSAPSSSSSNCVEVLKDISFDTTLCTLTKTFVDVVKC